MDKSSILSHLQSETPKKEKVTTKLKGMVDRLSRNNPFGGGFNLQRQAAGSAPHTGTVRKSTPRSGKKQR